MEKCTEKSQLAKREDPAELCAATEKAGWCLRGLTNLPEVSSLTVVSFVGSTSGAFAFRLWCSGASLDLKPHDTQSYKSGPRY